LRDFLFFLATDEACLPSAVRTDFGKCAIVRFRFAAEAAFFMFFRAAIRCFVETMFPDPPILRKTTNIGRHPKVTIKPWMNNRIEWFVDDLSSPLACTTKSWHMTIETVPSDADNHIFVRRHPNHGSKLKPRKEFSMSGMLKILLAATFAGLFGICAAAGQQANDNSTPSASSGATTNTNKESAGRTMADTRFMKAAAEGGLAEVALGQLAVEKASSGDVKKFGQRMVDDHSKANEQLKQLAAQKNVRLLASCRADAEQASKGRCQ
jgi:predicted outer membrane protein